MDRRTFIKLFGTTIFLPFVATPQRKRNWYIAPDMGTGTIVDPFTLAEALASNSIGAGDTVYLRGGVYEYSGAGRLPIRANVTWRAYENERPIITHENGEPPPAFFNSGATISGIWFGGTRPASVEESNTIVHGAGVTVEDCTFFNYINALQNGDTAHGNTFRRNRFVRCGNGILSHPLYIASSDDVITEENIYAACEGYSIHYYHAPERGIARWNFVGDAKYGIAFNGYDHTVLHNIIWGAEQAMLFWHAGGRNDISRMDGNVWRNSADNPPSPSTPSAVKTFDGNYFVGDLPTRGTNPVTWQEADVQANLGDSSASIDAAIAALDTAFQQTVAQIQADETIETHFATLKAVIDTWKANTR